MRFEIGFFSTVIMCELACGRQINKRELEKIGVKISQSQKATP